MMTKKMAALATAAVLVLAPLTACGEDEGCDEGAGTTGVSVMALTDGNGGGKGGKGKSGKFKPGKSGDDDCDDD